MEFVLSEECSTIDIALKKSCILCNLMLGKENIICYYYNSFVCENFSAVGSRFKMYDKSVIKMSRETFLI